MSCDLTHMWNLKQTKKTLNLYRELRQKWMKGIKRYKIPVIK